MIVNFVGNTTIGMSGEVADETHIVREMKDQGHDVRFIPRDEWREYVIEKYPENKYKVPTNLKADINIICKWHHFYDGSFVKALKELSGAPVIYWVWDYMPAERTFPDWHLAMAKEADLFLSGEKSMEPDYRANGIRYYYFSFDSCDGNIKTYSELNKKYGVVFLGGYTEQGDRIKYIQEIDKVSPVTAFAPNYQEWKKIGIRAEPAVWGEDFNRVVAESSIVLGFSGNTNCWGYWSNRVGKVLRAGGFLLHQFTPGMEIFLGKKMEYFSSIEEAKEKVKFYMENPEKREDIVKRALVDPDEYTSKRKVEQLMILAERFVREDKGKLWGDNLS